MCMTKKKGFVASDTATVVYTLTGKQRASMRARMHMRAQKDGWCGSSWGWGRLAGALRD